MSLIQDALKRQQEEMNKKTAEAASPTSSPVPGVKPVGKLETPGAPPPVIPQPRIPLRMMGQPAAASKPAEQEAAPQAPFAAPPAPEPAKHELPKNEPDAPPPLPHPAAADAARNEPDSEKRNPALLIASLVILLLAFVGLGLYWAWPRISSSIAIALPSTAPAAAPDKPAAETAPAPEVPAGSTNVAPAAEPIAIAITIQSNSPPPVPAAELLATHSNKHASLLVPEAPVPSPFVPVAAKTPPPPPVLWPGVKLTGMVKLGGTAAALINGRVVAPGESIEDVKLVTVNKDGALLLYKGEERLLRVGETAR